MENVSCVIVRTYSFAGKPPFIQWPNGFSYLGVPDDIEAEPNAQFLYLLL